MGNELEKRGQLFFLVGGTKGSLSKNFKLTKLSHNLIEELLFCNILAKPCAERLKFISKSRCQMALLFKY